MESGCSHSLFQLSLNPLQRTSVKILHGSHLLGNLLWTVRPELSPVTLTGEDDIVGLVDKMAKDSIQATGEEK